MVKLQTLVLTLSFFSFGVAESFQASSPTFRGDSPLAQRLHDRSIQSRAAPILRLSGGAVAASLEGQDIKLQLAGKLLPAITSSFKATENFGVAFSSILNTALVADWVAILGLWASVTPAMQFFNKIANVARARANQPTKDFDETVNCAIANSLRVLSRMLMALYIFDVFMVALSAFNIRVRGDLPQLLATVVKPAWLGFLASEVKGWALGVMPGQTKNTAASVFGRKLVYNRLADFGIGVLSAIVALDMLSLELGVALTSLLAVGGLSSVVVALACQEPLSHLVYGLLVTFSDKFRPGEPN